MHKYAFFDIDNTIYDGYCTSDFYLFLAKEGYLKNTDYVYKKDKEIGENYYSGKIDYAETSRQVVQLTADILKDVSKQDVNLWKKKFMKSHGKLFSWVKPLFTYLENNGYFIYLVSAAASPPVEAVSEYLKTNKFYASNLTLVKDVYSGNVELMLNYEEKTKLIHRITSHLEHSFKIGFGDLLGDIDMLKQMNEAFLFNPKIEELKTLAKKEGIHIVNGKNIIDVTTKYVK